MKLKVVVGIIVENEHGQILMGKKENARIYPGQWILPGGGVDEGESVNEAAVREVKEETNLDITNLTRINFDDGIMEKVERDGTKNTYHTIFLNYRAKVKPGSKLRAKDDMVDLRWFKKEELEGFIVELCPPSIDLFKFLGWI